MHLNQVATIFLGPLCHVVVGKKEEWHLDAKNEKNIYEKVRFLLVGNSRFLSIVLHHWAERHSVVVCTDL